MNKQSTPSAAERAAKAYAEDIVGKAIAELKENYGGDYTPGADTIALVMKYFLAGSDWQRQSVWHEISEVPDVCRDLVLLCKNGSRDLVLLCKNGSLFAPFSLSSSDKWNFHIIITEAIQWAYADDLKSESSNTK